jgi:hypothetical protein
MFLFPASAASQLIGGFGAPIYFIKFDQTQINQINQIKKVKMVKLTYPHNLHHLAQQIAAKITIVKKAQIKLDEVNLPDTATTKYRHDAVVVILYFIN